MIYFCLKHIKMIVRHLAPNWKTIVNMCKNKTVDKYFESMIKASSLSKHNRIYDAKNFKASQFNHELLL